MQLAIVIIYFAIILGLSMYISRKNKGIKEFLVSGGGLGVASLVPMLFSELIAGSGTVGNASTAYEVGISSVWMNWGTAIGCFFTVFTVSKFYKVMSWKGKMSVGEAIADYFDERTRMVMVFITAVVYLIIFSLQPSAAAGILSPMLGLSAKLVVWIVGILFIIIAVTGGIEGLAKVNFIHSLIMLFGMSVSCFASIRYAGGLNHVYTVMPEGTFDLFKPGLFTVIAWAFGSALNLPAGSMIAAVIFGAKDLKTANRSLVYAGIILVPFSIMIAMIGISAKAAGLLIAKNNVIYTITSAVNPVLAGFASMAILAAILSTAPVMLMLTAGTITRDLYKGYINKDATSKQQLIFTKIVVILLGLVGIAMGLNIKSILSQLLGALQIRSVAGVVIMISLMWNRVDNRAAFWSMAVGGIIAALWFFSGSPFGIEPIWPSCFVGILILVVLTLTSKEKIYSGHLRYKESEMEFVISEKNKVKRRDEDNKDYQLEEELMEA